MITRLYEKYHTELLRWCQGITGDRQSAEELVQETWLRALEHTGQLAALEEKQCRTAAAGAGKSKKQSGAVCWKIFQKRKAGYL